jgi:hypothetical protein
MIQTPEMNDLVSEKLRQFIGQERLDRFLADARITMLERALQRASNRISELEAKLTPPEEPEVPADG